MDELEITPTEISEQVQHTMPREQASDVLAGKLGAVPLHEEREGHVTRFRTARPSEVYRTDR
jgi:hypothetical protein